MSKLVLFLPDGTTLDIPLTRERTTIGRRADNDICLPHLAVSGEHAVVVTILADSFLEDLTAGAVPRHQKEVVAAPPVPPAPPPTPQGPSLRLLTGLKAGTLIALTKSETTLGRPGVQVASIVQEEASFRIKPVEGISPPSLNGQPVGSDGAILAPGDIIEVAGTRVEYLDPGVAAAKQDATA